MARTRVVDESVRGRGMLVNAVLKQLGGTLTEARADLKEVAQHGADGGWNGFIYYADTHKFAKAHYEDIVEAIEETYGSYGEWVASLKAPLKDDILNSMAWFALEWAAVQEVGEVERNPRSRGNPVRVKVGKHDELTVTKEVVKVGEANVPKYAVTVSGAAKAMFARRYGGKMVQRGTFYFLGDGLADMVDHSKLPPSERAMFDDLRAFLRSGDVPRWALLQHDTETLAEAERRHNASR